MSKKKLIAAVCFCIIAIIFAFFKTEPELKTENTIVKEFSKSDKLKKAKQQPEEIVKEEIAPAIPTPQVASERMLSSEVKQVEAPPQPEIHDSIPISNDPYQDLLNKIDNQEQVFSEEQKIESLNKYLETTVSAAQLENAETPVIAENPTDAPEGSQNTDRGN